MYTSAIFQQWPHTSSFGIIATDDHSTPQIAKAMVRRGSRSRLRLALEAVRAAQLLVYQNRWEKIIIWSDVKEMVTALQHNRNMHVDHLPISEDIILLQHIFDDCCFSFV